MNHSGLSSMEDSDAIENEDEVDAWRVFCVIRWCMDPSSLSWELMAIGCGVCWCNFVWPNERVFNC